MCYSFFSRDKTPASSSSSGSRRKDGRRHASSTSSQALFLLVYTSTIGFQRINIDLRTSPRDPLADEKDGSHTPPEILHPIPPQSPFSPRPRSCNLFFPISFCFSFSISLHWNVICALGWDYKLQQLKLQGFR